MTVERLEKRGYELDRSDALAVMKFFVEYGMFEKSANLEAHWYDKKKFASKAKYVMMNPSLSLYELIRMRPEEAKKSFTYADYFACSCANGWDKLPGEFRHASSANLCEIMSRGFFRRWTLEFFLELTHLRLPILCCEKIVNQLTNKDLLCICLAVANQLSSDE
ncbi:unnamed protein product [Trichogramma brassicae]|uniref:Uncharacterized protein n=1 Tax=Trichogramma brassicae TaxID=86971 RepID=A0A6H5J6T3_9HYME|nr:unnamed protein product [Trichogramma brassicae]